MNSQTLQACKHHEICRFVTKCSMVTKTWNTYVLDKARIRSASLHYTFSFMDYHPHLSALHCCTNRSQPSYGWRWWPLWEAGRLLSSWWHSAGSIRRWVRTRSHLYDYIYTSTGGGSAAPRVAKPDGVVDGIFPWNFYHIPITTSQTFVQ
jgi:hypothetical protein